MAGKEGYVTVVDTSQSNPLLDLSGGRLRGWPGGSMYIAGVQYPSFRKARDGDRLDDYAEVKPARRGRWVYCKYCYRNTLPLALHEFLQKRDGSQIHGIMLICSRCGSGLETIKSGLDDAQEK